MKIWSLLLFITLFNNFLNPLPLYLIPVATAEPYRRKYEQRLDPFSEFTREETKTSLSKLSYVVNGVDGGCRWWMEWM